MANREDLLIEAEEKGVEVPENATKAEIKALIEAAGDVDSEPAPENTDDETDVTPVQHQDEPEETPAPAESGDIGKQIASAIVEGMNATKEDKRIKITSDPSVTSRFSVVKNAQGVILTRENETGELSEVQLKSLEEKKAEEQNQEVTVL